MIADLSEYPSYMAFAIGNCARQYKNAYGLTDVPVIKNIHQTLHQAITADLSKFSMWRWHTSCGIVHCRAGWVQNLANTNNIFDDRLELITQKICPEREIISGLAAMLIYEASGYIIDPLNFFIKNDVAFVKIKSLAEQEIAAVRSANFRILAVV